MIGEVVMELILRRDILWPVAAIYSHLKTIIQRFLGAVPISWQTDLLAGYITQ